MVINISQQERLALWYAKKTGELENASNKVSDVCGCQYNAIVIKRTIEWNELLELSQ